MAFSLSLICMRFFKFSKTSLNWASVTSERQFLAQQQINRSVSIGGIDISLASLEGLSAEDSHIVNCTILCNEIAVHRRDYC